MKAVIQRVSKASVEIDEFIAGEIQTGLLVLLGIGVNDKPEDVDWLVGKILRLRIFDNENGVMDLSVSDTGGEILVISQFTLHASTKKGNRPSYIQAEAPDKAEPLFDYFVDSLKEQSDIKIRKGKFGSYMKVSLINEGPVTIIIDTKHKA